LILAFAIALAILTVIVLILPLYMAAVPVQPTARDHDTPQTIGPG
jgi:hypothetical protein